MSTRADARPAGREVPTASVKTLPVSLNPGPPNFDRLAHIYRWMELVSFGPWLWRCRCHFLGEMSGCRHALVLGDGDGRFTARLLQTNPALRIDAVDASPAMLRVLIRRAGRHAARVQTHLADARDWQAASPESNPPCDLVVSHFFLDCLTGAQIEALAERIHAAVSPGARWVISEFAIPQGRFGSLMARGVVWGLYRAFGWLTGLKVRQLPDHAEALQGAGFSLETRRVWLGGLLASELWAATSAVSEPRE